MLNYPLCIHWIYSTGSTLNISLYIYPTTIRQYSSESYGMVPIPINAVNCALCDKDYCTRFTESFSIGAI